MGSSAWVSHFPGFDKQFYPPSLRYFQWERYPWAHIFECLIPCWRNCQGLGGVVLSKDVYNSGQVLRFPNLSPFLVSFSLPPTWSSQLFSSVTTARCSRALRHDGHRLILWGHNLPLNSLFCMLPCSWYLFIAVEKWLWHSLNRPMFLLFSGTFYSQPNLDI